VAVTAAPTQLHPGDLVDDRYRVVDLLGAGGFSETYLATDERDGSRVALKAPNPAILGDAQTFERFRREMAISRKLDHPHIQRSLDRGENRSFPYMVLEYVEGESLRRHLAGRLPLPADQAVGYARQLASALAHAHRLGVAHRDLKPENVLVTADGQLKLTDFGIALLAGARRVTWRWLNNAVGTPDYMAPEQIQGKRGDERTDVYALGIMLYEMLAGRVPFSGDSPLAVMAQAVNVTPEPLHRVNPAVPPPLEAVVHKAIRKEPGERYSSMEQMLHDLDHLDDLDLGQFVLGPERTGRRLPSDRTIVLFGVAVGVGFILLIVIAVLITILLEHR
jgi:serine/threonine protein kinase